ncbi:uncharacterized protein V1518DRAFT_412042 [Limtongia smithiae]|uniref:uncharacterized protein n=1 Tax=Limtongia smithiae TaxID=1125753 RepID=UPI0034D0227A
MAISFVPVESNPEVLTSLARALGLDKSVAFHDVYSLELLDFVPRPALALILVFPVTPAYEAVRRELDSGRSYTPLPTDDIIWLRQTINNACGTYALLHSALNGSAAAAIVPGSVLDQFHRDLPLLSTPERASYIESSHALRESHDSAAHRGDTEAPAADADVDLHYVAFVKADSGMLYELDGRRVGPVALTTLGPDDDVLSPEAIKFVQSFIDRDSSSSMQFSLLALAPAMD